MGCTAAGAALMGRVVRRRKAQQDLSELWFSIAEDYGIERADAFLSEMEEKFSKLADHPYMGRSRDELIPDLRSFPMGNYLIFYTPLSDGIRVFRVLNARRDIVAMFETEEN
jgi:toxin ParE1/3/4